MIESVHKIAPNFDLHPVVGQRFILDTPSARASISVDDTQFITFKQYLPDRLTIPHDESNDIMDWSAFSMEYLRMLSAGPEAPGGVL